MINVNTSEMQLFYLCVEQLWGTFIRIKKSQEEWQTTSDRTKFRVPIQLYIIEKGKKFILPTKNGQYILSKGEVECVQCLIDGLSAKESASRLFLSPRTVETYINNIKNKLKCRTKRDIIRLVYMH